MGHVQPTKYWSTILPSTKPYVSSNVNISFEIQFIYIEIIKSNDCFGVYEIKNVCCQKVIILKGFNYFFQNTLYYYHSCKRNENPMSLLEIHNFCILLYKPGQIFALAHTHTHTHT